LTALRRAKHTRDVKRDRRPVSEGVPETESAQPAADGAPAPASAVVWCWRPLSVDPAAARRSLRRGLVRALVALGVAVLLALWKPLLGIVAAALALLLAAVALASPLGLYPRIEGAIAAFGRGVGAIVGRAALLVLHLAVFTPLGLLLRMTGRLRFERSPDPGASSYWRTPDGPRGGLTRHERQF